MIVIGNSSGVDQVEGGGEAMTSCRWNNRPPAWGHMHEEREWKEARIWEWFWSTINQKSVISVFY
jgi:hypothetical protein